LKDFLYCVGRNSESGDLVVCKVRVESVGKKKIAIERHWAFDQAARISVDDPRICWTAEAAVSRHLASCRAAVGTWEAGFKESIRKLDEAAMFAADFERTLAFAGANP
jgi:hypothetical protein